MWNRDIKLLIFLLFLVGFILSLMIFGCLFYNPIHFNTDDMQGDIIPQHYNLEFTDHLNYMICHTRIFLQFTQPRERFSIIKSIDHIIELSSIVLYQNQVRIPIRIRIENDQIIIKKRQWTSIFLPENYSVSILTRINISNTIKASFIRQIWSQKYRILFTNNHLFPYVSHSFHLSTFNINIISSDHIISNLPLNQTSSLFDISQIAFALLYQYECRSLDILQLCLPLSLSYDIDFYTYIFNYTLNTIQIFETYFSRIFPLNKLTLITVLELNNRFISVPGLVFIDQNIFLTNISAEQIFQQRQFIYFILAYQWIDTLMQFEKDYQWIKKSLAKTISNYLFNKINDPVSINDSQIKQYISSVILDSLCNNELIQESNNIKSGNISIEKGEAFLTEYRIYIGDIQFRSRIQQLIQYSNSSYLNQSTLSSILFADSDTSSFLTWSKIPGHPIIYINSSTLDMHLFKFNSNCSTSIPSIYPITYPHLSDPSSSIYHLERSSNNYSSNLLPINPFIHLFHPSWNRLIGEMKTFRPQQLTKLLFESFLFNFANQLSIKYPLQLINQFFQQSLSILTKDDLILLNQILKWYQSMLTNSIGDKFYLYLRKMLNPFCSNQLWTKQILNDIKHYNQQIINDILLELCCSINHSICLQQISNRHDPQILIQTIFNTQQFVQTKSISNNNQIDMLTSFNQLQIPSPFVYPDRIITNIVCQIVRQQNEKYWYDLIQLIQQKYQNHIIPASLSIGLSCAIRATEQVDFYLNNLCPPSPYKWPCYRNILTYSSIKTFDQLKTIDDEHWPTNEDELIDFLFHTSNIQGNFSSHPLIIEFQSLILTWFTNNQYEFLHWLDNENNQNAYFI